MLSYYETFMVAVILGIFVWEIVRIYRSSCRVEWFAPPLFFALLFVVYTVVGPIVFLYAGRELVFSGFVDYTREFYTKAWEGAVVALVSFYIAYLTSFRRYGEIGLPENDEKKVIGPYQAFRGGLRIYVIGYGIYFLANPVKALAQLNPLYASGIKMVDEGTLGGYIVNMINFTLLGLVIMGIALMNITKKRHWIVFLCLLVVGLLTYTSIGFRFRLYCLAIGLVAGCSIYRNRMPALKYIIGFAVVLVVYSGLIASTRTYGSGIDLDRIGDEEQVIFGALNDVNIFPLSGAAMKAVPDKIPFVYFAPITGAILSPIPRTFYPAKDTESYTRDPIEIYPLLARMRAHQWGAITYYAEWYLAFGWPGIIVISFLLGRLYKYLWIRSRISRNDVLVVAQYAGMYFMLFLIFSRGLFPMMVTLFFFIVFPAFALRNIMIGNIDARTSGK